MLLSSPPGEVTSTVPSGVSPGFTAMAVGDGVKGGVSAAGDVCVAEGSA
jgi:hypothetical protein